MSGQQPEPEGHDEPPGTADKQNSPQEWLRSWMGEQESVVSADSWRLSHMMWLIAAIAVILFLIVKVGAPFVVFGAVLLFAMAVGAGVILARRRSTQQDSLLWIMAIAAEGNMPLAPTVAAFADQYRGKYRRRIMNLAAELDSGRSVPEALENVRRVVSRDALLLARVGEKAGRLPQALRLAASSRSSQLPIWTAIATRLAYLLALLLFMQSMCGFMLYFIIPKFESIFKDFGVPLPLSTIWMIEGSHFIITYGFFTAWIPPLELLLLVFLPFSFAGWVNFDVPFIDRLLKRTPPGLDFAGIVAGRERGQADRGRALDSGQSLSHLVGAAQADQGRRLRCSLANRGSAPCGGME